MTCNVKADNSPCGDINCVLSLFGQVTHLQNFGCVTRLSTGEWQINFLTEVKQMCERVSYLRKTISESLFLLTPLLTLNMCVLFLEYCVIAPLISIIWLIFRDKG